MVCGRTESCNWEPKYFSTVLSNYIILICHFTYLGFNFSFYKMDQAGQPISHGGYKNIKLFIGLAIIVDSIDQHWLRGLAGAIRQQLWYTETRFEQPTRSDTLGTAKTGSRAEPRGVWGPCRGHRHTSHSVLPLVLGISPKRSASSISDCLGHSINIYETSKCSLSLGPTLIHPAASQNLFLEVSAQTMPCTEPISV